MLLVSTFPKPASPWDVGCWLQELFKRRCERLSSRQNWLIKQRIKPNLTAGKVKGLHSHPGGGGHLLGKGKPQGGDPGCPSLPRLLLKIHVTLHLARPHYPPMGFSHFSGQIFSPRHKRVYFRAEPVGQAPCACNLSSQVQSWAVARPSPSHQRSVRTGWLGPLALETNHHP